MPDCQYFPVVGNLTVPSLRLFTDSLARCSLVTCSSKQDPLAVKRKGGKSIIEHRSGLPSLFAAMISSECLIVNKVVHVLRTGARLIQLPALRINQRRSSISIESISLDPE